MYIMLNYLLFSFTPRASLTLSGRLTPVGRICISGRSELDSHNQATDSGFSGEDLVSDLLGFYRVVSVKNPFSMLRPVSKEEALKRWDHYGKIGIWKNKTFQPLLFPDPAKNPHARPYKGILPSFMRTVVPYNDFLSGNVILPRHDKTFVILGKGNDRMGL